MGENKGFTLIETLVVISLMGIILVGGGGLFFNIMKGASKAEVEKEVKQNGEYAMAIMERMIKNSKGVTDCSRSEELTIENIDGGLTTFSLDDGKIASSGASLTGDNIDAANSLSFVCIYEPEGTSLPKNIRRVEIGFTLQPKGGIPEAPPETYSKIDFQTSVSLRNFEE